MRKVNRGKAMKAWQKGFGFLETILAIGVLSTLFASGLFFAREALNMRKLEGTSENLDVLVKSFHVYGRIPTDNNDFRNFLRSVLKTDLDLFSRPYVLVLANNVSSNVQSTCFANSTDLSVQLPGGITVNDVVMVILSAGEDGRHNTLGQDYSVPHVVRRRGHLSLNPNDLFKVVTLTEFKSKNCDIEGQSLGGYAYGRLFVNQRPRFPRVGDLFYNANTGRLERYGGERWVEINWMGIVQTSMDWQNGILSIVDNRLWFRSPLGWIEVIPAVGAKTIEIVHVDNENASIDGRRPRYLYWIDVGTTVIFRNTNHLPIVYNPFPFINSVVFEGVYWNTFPYEYWIGLKPSNARISNGVGQFVAGSGDSAGAGATGNLTIVPIMEQSHTRENWAEFTLTIRVDPSYNQRWLTTGVGQGHGGYVVASTVGSGTVPVNSFWLGTFATTAWQECYCVMCRCRSCIRIIFTIRCRDWTDYGDRCYRSGCHCTETRCVTHEHIIPINHIVLTRTS